MTSTSQIHANQINAQASSGPRSPESKARVAQNSVTHGLFAAHDIVRPEEQPEYDELRAALEAELLPETTMERTHAKEILHATWRLRRCAVVEGNLTQSTIDSGLDPMENPDTAPTQAAIDRARAHARNNLRRAAADLSKLQTERYLRTQLAPETPDNLMSHQIATKTLAHDTRRRLNLRKLEDLDTFEKIFTRAAGAFNKSPAEKINTPITKQSQSTGRADPPPSPATRSSPDNSAPSRSSPSPESRQSGAKPPEHRNASSQT